LLKQGQKLGRFTSSLYICHTKAMTALAEYQAFVLNRNGTQKRRRTSSFSFRGKFSWNFIRWRHRAYSTVVGVQLFANGHR